MAMTRKVLAKLSKAHTSYNHCGLCGRTPKSELEEANHAPILWWDADDGWRITTLCRWCVEETIDDKPQPADYAYERRSRMTLDNVDTDEDPSEAL